MTQKTATIALIGIPNAGKSTLMNALIKAKVAAVHRKPQMTRKNQIGIITDGTTQLVFVDTPGLHQNTKVLNQIMQRELYRVIDESDVIAILVEVHTPVPVEIEAVIQSVKKKKKEWALIINKMDMPPHRHVLNKEDLQQKYQASVLAVSALKEDGLAALLDYLKGQAREHPFCYDPDDLTTATCREIAAECLREKMMEYLHKEIPYESTVYIEAYKEGPQKIKIDAVIVVNKKSQKGIVLGENGVNIRRIRKAAELEFAKVVGVKVVFKLFVKVDDGWVSHEQKIREYF
ncbi:MAG: GTPase Era [Deltaproteobacteria bacterium]|nr:GTPase Era [Deltaproteobacteria bacterium]